MSYDDFKQRCAEIRARERIAQCYERAMKIQAEEYIQTLTDESVMGEVAELYLSFDELVAAGKLIKPGYKFRHGVNSFGDPQLYIVIGAEHKPTNLYPPSTASLYKMIGVTAAGIPIWTQPLNGEDAYDKGDEVAHNGWIWRSTLDGKNVWEPGGIGIDERYWIKVRPA